MIKKEMKTKHCPICYTVMMVKRYQHNHKGQQNIYDSVYCRRCGYGLQQAFSSRLNAIIH